MVAFPQRRFRLTLAAAAAVLIALSSAITWRIARPPATTLTARPGSPTFSLAAFRPTADLLEAEREYASATGELLSALEARRDSLAPETLVTVEESLREAVRADPANNDLTQMLTATHKRKVDALRRVVRLSRI